MTTLKSFKDYLFLRKIGKKFKKKLKKLYSRKITNYNVKIAKLIYKNLANRYSLSVKEIYNCLPLKIEIDKEMEGAYGLCETYLDERKFLFFKTKKMMKSNIYLNGKDVTTTTFIHEFGHYLRFLIARIAMHRNKKAIEDFKRVVDLVRSRSDASVKKHDNYWTRGSFTVDEEENFAKSWEQYLKDGIAPCAKHKKLFQDFRKYIYADMYQRNEKRKYEFYEDLEVRITPERKQFFDELIIGKKLKKDGLFIRMLEIYIYLALIFVIFKIIEKYIWASKQ